MLADVLVGYGQAWRGDWAFFDGRTMRDDMNQVAEWLREPDTYPGDDEARKFLGFCNKSTESEDGHGHWHEWCTTYHPNDMEGCC